MNCLLVFAIAFGPLFSCKSASESAINEHSEQIYNGPICCIEQNKSGVFYRTVTCKGSAQDCCRRPEFQPFKSKQTRFFDYFVGNCDDAGPEFLTNVQICRGRTNFGAGAPVAGQISDAASGVFKLAHAWIKTSTLEVGMGSAEHSPDQNKDSKLRKFTELFNAEPLRQKFKVAWTDHSGFSELEGAHCEQLYFCDEECVNKQLVIGTPLGNYSIINQCHVRAVEVLRSCGCMNHCVKREPLTGRCLKRVFPELRGFKLSADPDGLL